ncbi:MAG: ATP-binding protein [Pseudomonadota bacterium]
MTPRKWRPTLSMIVLAMVAAALLLPLTGVLFFRIYENQLIRNTETELIAQSAALAGVMTTWLDDAGGTDLPLGPFVKPEMAGDDAPASAPKATSRWNPTLPQLNLHEATILPERPDALPAETQAAPAYRQLGEAIFPILQRTQQATLAGFRVLDFNGTVISGRDEVGQSLAHIPEVQHALEGRYTSAIRRRVVENPQPIYSISRGTTVRLFTAFPVLVGDRLAGVIYASRTPSNVVKEFYALRNRLALAGLAICALALLMVLIFSRTIANPIHQLRERTHRIGQGDRSAIGPLHRHGSREVFDLSNALMAMSQTLFERTDYINMFAAHVSHELKSPFTSIRGAVELLKEGDMTAADQARFLDNIAQDAERGTVLLEQLRALARADNVDIRGTCRLVDIVDACRARFAPLTIAGDHDATLPMSAEHAAIMFDNLLENARQHGATTVTIDKARTDVALTILIRDDGDGISDGNAPRIFDLFFTTRRQTGGTGLGLSIVQSLLNAHDGTIAVYPPRSGAQPGAHFQIVFQDPSRSLAIR